VTELPSSPIGAVRRLIASIEQAAIEATNAYDPEKRAELRAEAEELKARKWVVENVDDLRRYLITLIT
jgi:hypothetical protein